MHCMGLLKAEGGYDQTLLRQDLQEVSHQPAHVSDLGAAFFEPWVREAPALVALVVDFTRVGTKYGLRGERFALVEAGAMMQLIEDSLNRQQMVGCRVGGYRDDVVLSHFGLSHSRFGIADILAFGWPDPTRA